MIRGTRRQAYPQWEAHDMRARMAAAYLLGTLGVGIVLVFIFIVMLRAGWMGDLPTVVRQIELPGLPRASQSRVHDVFQGIAGKVRNTTQSTSKLWQRRPQPSAAGRTTR